MNNKIPLQIPAILEKYSSLSSGELKLTFATQENINPKLLAAILALQNKLGWLSFNVEQIEAIDLLPTISTKVDKSKYDKAKTPSQRLRAVLYLIWEKNKLEEPFDDYYNRIMEKLIEQYKEKLD